MENITIEEYGDDNQPTEKKLTDILGQNRTLICSVTFYQYQQLQAVKSNIESAIVKGIDPVAVRCAYSNEKDVVCVAYGVGASRK